MVQAPAGLWLAMLQLVPAVVGSVSETCTLLAVPGPLLVTVIVKPMPVPADTLLASAVLRMWIDGQSTVIATVGVVPPLPLVNDRLGVLLYVAQLVLVVLAVMCPVSVTPDAKLIGCPARVSCWLPSLPLMLKAVGVPVLPSITQCTGVDALPPGNASLRVTPVALPAPLLLTVTV